MNKSFTYRTSLIVSCWCPGSLCQQAQPDIVQWGQDMSIIRPLWCDGMEWVSALLVSEGRPLVINGFSLQTASNGSFHVSFVVSLNKLLNKQ